MITYIITTGVVVSRSQFQGERHFSVTPYDVEDY